MARRPGFLRNTRRKTIPERSGAPVCNIDQLALQNRLQELAVENPNSKSEILAVLKETRQSAMDEAIALFERGRHGGIETARLIAAIHDEIIKALFHVCTMHVIPKPEGKTTKMLAICAVGGFGRGEMAPGSDLDLLFLLPDKKGQKYAEAVTEYMLYMLWDMGLKVGQSIRTLDQNIQLAKTDQTILTALLDLRFVCGNQPLAEKLFVKFKRDITKGKGRAYIAAKLEERDIRHDRAGNSRYVIEPNIKEGKGGLRDLHVLYWIARFLDRDGTITDAQKPSIYVDMGLFDEAAATRFERAADFLWRARIHLHLTAGRPMETLSFDHQTVLARKMGYASGAIEEAVEKFMREYFTNAREVGALTRIACATLEADNSLRLPKGLDALLPNSKRNLTEDGFILDHGRLMFQDPMQLRDEPSLVLSLFEIAGRRNLDIHPHAISAIDFRRNLIDNTFRASPENAKIFEDILLGSQAPYATLKVMNEAGVLGRYLQEFGGIVARTQFNMHHAYTVDEHTLRLVGYFHDILSGEFETNHPVLTEIVQGFSKHERLCIYLACLLHDTGKGKGNQCVEGAQLARQACRRLHMSKDIKDTVSWLVRRHLDMSETAQRRDISSPETITEFGETVGSLSRLQMLYALTVVDIRSVGPGVWNDWKGMLLRDLYSSTAAFLDGRSELEPASKAAAAYEQLSEKLPESVAERISPITDELGQAYWLSFSMSDLTRHAEFYEKTIAKSKDHNVHTWRNKSDDITELWVLTRDRRALFTDLCGVIAASGAEIVGARLHTGHNGRVMDVFYLQNTEGFAFGRINSETLRKLRAKIRKVLEGKAYTISLPSPKVSRRAAAIPIKSSVKFIEQSATQQTIIEIEGRDRPGLLYALGQCLLQADIALSSAHIEVVGNKAIDAFYVQGPNGLLSKTEKTKIKKSLIAVLNMNEAAVAA